MIIFLYGPDTYRRQRKMREIVADYAKKHSTLSIDSFDLAEESGRDGLKDFCQANSLFDAFKFGTVKNADGLPKADQKAFIALLKDVLGRKETVLLILADKKPNKEFAFLLKKPAIAQEFASPEGPAAVRFIEEEAKRRGVALERGCAEYLAKAFQGDSWGAATELDKLALLEGKAVTLAMLKSHIEAFDEVNLFSVLGRLRSGQGSAERLRVLENLLARHEDPAMLFNMIAVAPYESSAWKRAAADYDAAIKSGKLDYAEVLLSIALA
ncbi:MAG: hypothetical protein KGI60_01445 [Patescibacteria group bacterium]|nr:hypothetical protein [Patescibacteria group bacterium]